MLRLRYVFRRYWAWLRIDATVANARTTVGKGTVAGFSARVPSVFGLASGFVFRRSSAWFPTLLDLLLVGGLDRGCKSAKSGYQTGKWLSGW